MGWPYPIVPILGVVREHTGPAVQPTPHLKLWPILGELLMAFQMTSTQEVDLSVRFADRKGNPATVQVAPSWQVDNPNVLALTPAADGLSCKVSAVGPLGAALVSIQADADLGEGIKNLAGTFAVEVVGGEAVVVEITPGTPQEQP